MAELTIPALVEGGKATAGPPLGPALGPLGVNIGNVIAEINEKTKAFVGITVPVKVIVDKSKKTFRIEVGTPPVSALIKKELGLKEPVKEEAGVKGKNVIGDLQFAQIVKIAQSKRGASLSKTLKAGVKEVLGTCLSLGVTVDGKNARAAIADVAAGAYDSQIK